MSVIVKHTMVFNAEAGLRRETLNGEEYLVAPVVIFTDDVHTANAGPLYYSPEENKKQAPLWNHMPVVVYHPQKNGKLISARSPDVLEKRQVGFVFNAEYDGRVQAEVWVNVKKADKVDDRIVANIEAGKTLEVSGGVLLEPDGKEGEVDGKKYVGTATNIRPDHLALLPDKTGACNAKKGCGCGKNVLQPLVANEASFSRISQAISAAMQVQFGYNVYVRDVYSDFFVYSTGYGPDAKLYKRGYTMDAEGDDATIATGEPVEVEWVQEYRTTDGTFVGNASHQPKEEPNVADNTKKLIADILACNVGYEEADFTGMKEPQLQKILTNAQKSVVANPAPQPPPTPAPAPAPQPQPQGVTAKQWLVANNAPPILHQMFDSFQAQHAQLVANIMAMPANKLTQVQLEQMDPVALSNLEKMLTPPQVVAVGNMSGGNWFGGQAVAAPAGNHPKPQPLPVVDPFGAVKK